MSYNIRVGSSSTSSIPQYWSQQVISATQKNIYYNYGNAGIGIPLPKASIHLVNNCCIGSAFATSNVPTDSLIVSSNVGIGTALPQATLHVQGNALVTGNLTVQGSNITNTNYINAIEYNSSNVVINNISGTGPALKVSQTGSGTNYPIADFYDNDVSTTIPALRIADGGYVGIGTTNPQAILHVNGDVLCNGYMRGSQRIAVYTKNDPTNTGAINRYFPISTGTMSFNGSFVTNSLVTLNPDNTTFVFNRVGLYKCLWQGNVVSQNANYNFLSIYPGLSGGVTADGGYPSNVLCAPGWVTGARQFICKVTAIGATMNITLQPSSNDPTTCSLGTYTTEVYVRLYIEYIE